MRVHVSFRGRRVGTIGITNDTSIVVGVDGSEDYSAVVREVYKTHEHIMGMQVRMVCDGHKCCVMRDGRLYELPEDGRSEQPVSRGKSRKLARFFQPEVGE